MKIKAIVFSALSFALAASAHALVVSEDFNYTTNAALNGQNGGSGWGGAWSGSNTPIIGTPSLDYPGMTETGNNATLPYDGSTYTIFRALGGTVSGSNSSAASFSFLFNMTGNDSDTGIRFAGLSFFSGGSGGTEVFFFGKPGNTDDIGIEKYAGGQQTLGVNTSFSSSTVFLFQANFTLSQSASTVSVTLSDNSGGGTVLANWNNLSLGSNFEFDTVRLIRDFALDNTIDPIFDEISLSTTAVPEPSAALLALPGLAFVLLVRRRFSQKKA